MVNVHVGNMPYMNPMGNRCVKITRKSIKTPNVHCCSVTKNEQITCFLFWCFVLVRGHLMLGRSLCFLLLVHVFVFGFRNGPQTSKLVFDVVT